LPTQRGAVAGGKEKRATVLQGVDVRKKTDSFGRGELYDRSRADAGDRRLASGGADASDGLAAKGSEDVFPRVTACEGSQGRSRFAKRRVGGF